MPRALPAVAVLVLALALPSTLSAAGTRTVRLEDFKFQPSTLRIKKGDTVVWRFRDGVPHDVTSEGSRRFKSSKIKSTGTHRVRFTRAGTYRYICTVHPVTMKGKVVVR